jgi:hypothetical protein
MRRDLERRLLQIELAERARSITIEYWIFEPDGMVTGPRGERITRDAFNHLQSRDRPPTVFVDRGQTRARRSRFRWRSAE